MPSCPSQSFVSVVVLVLKFDRDIRVRFVSEIAWIRASMKFFLDRWHFYPFSRHFFPCSFQLICLFDIFLFRFWRSPVAFFSGAPPAGRLAPAPRGQRNVPFATTCWSSPGELTPDNQGQRMGQGRATPSPRPCARRGPPSDLSSRPPPLYVWPPPRQCCARS